MLAEHLFSALSSACVTVCICSFSVSFDSCCHSRLARQGRSSQSHPHVSSPHVVLYVLGCTRAILMYSMVLTDSLSDTNTSGIPFPCTCPVYRWWSWLLLWTRQDRERFYVSSVYLVINTELCQDTEYRIWTQIPRVHSSVVRAADCRSAGPWFNSVWRSCMVYFRDRIRQSDESHESDDQQNEPDDKKFSSDEHCKKRADWRASEMQDERETAAYQSCPSHGGGGELIDMEKIGRSKTEQLHDKKSGRSCTFSSSRCRAKTRTRSTPRACARSAFS